LIIGSSGETFGIRTQMQKLALIWLLSVVSLAITAYAQEPNYAALVKKASRLKLEKGSLASFEQAFGPPTKPGVSLYSTGGDVRRHDVWEIGKIWIETTSALNGSVLNARKVGHKAWVPYLVTAGVKFPEGHHFSPAEIGSTIEWFADRGVAVRYMPGSTSDQGSLLIDVPGQD